MRQYQFIQIACLFFKNLYILYKLHIFSSKCLCDSLHRRQILHWRHSHFFFKLSGKILYRSIGQTCSNFCDVAIFFPHHFPCTSDLHSAEIFHWSASEFLMEKMLQRRPAHIKNITECIHIDLLLNMLLHSGRPESVGNFSDVLSLPSVQTVWNRPPFLPAPCAASAKTAPDSAKSSAARTRIFPLSTYKNSQKSILSAVITTVVQIVFCSMAGYAFARIEFPFKNFIFVLLLSVLMVPGQIFLLPQYQLIQKMGLLNTIPALFLPNLFSAFGTFLLRQFFMSMPQELEDAAIVDGCNRFQIFGRIMVPLIQPGIAALTIFTFKFAWNDFMWPLIVNNSMDKLILGPALSTLQGQYTTQYPMQMAGAVLAVIPLVVIFFIFQKQFIESVATSGIKG